MEWIVVLVCLFLNALLAAAEIAFVTLTRAQLREVAKSGKKSALTLIELRENPERTLSVMQIGISLVGALAAAVGGAEAHQTIAPYFQMRFDLSDTTARVLSLLTVVVPITILSVVFGELVPKTLIKYFCPWWISLNGRRRKSCRSSSRAAKPRRPRPKPSNSINCRAKRASTY